MRARALYHVSPARVALGEVDVSPAGPRDLLVRTIASAISPGTEKLVFEGGLEGAGALDVSLTSLQGGFHYPFRYGYSLVGEVIDVGDFEDRPLIGRRVFAFHPHQDLAFIPLEACQLLPDDWPAERALFLPNMETALGLVQDTAPIFGERGILYGQGVVGLLATALLGNMGLSEIVSVDPVSSRRNWSLMMGAHASYEGSEFVPAPEGAGLGSDGFDFALELSGYPKVLNDAFCQVGMDGRIIVGSWYGMRQGLVTLGMEFHRRRQRLISSQVSTLGAALQLRWDKSRRLRLASEWLQKLRPERLVTHRFPIARAQAAFECLSCVQSDSLQILLEY